MKNSIVIIRDPRNGSTPGTEEGTEAFACNLTGELGCEGFFSLFSPVTL